VYIYREIERENPIVIDDEKNKNHDFKLNKTLMKKG